MNQHLSPRVSRRIRLGLIPLAVIALVCVEIRASEEVAYTAPDASQINKLDTEELHTLVAPVALYPDALLAQLLPASTFPTQVVEAYRYTQTSDTPTSPPEDTTWDSSVISLLHYAPVLKKLNDDVTWTEQLGFAVTYQMEDVSQAIQQVRSEAQAAGHLVSNDKQNVVVETHYIEILPTNPEIIYVPTYDPYYISDRYYDRPFYSWGIGFGFGLWLGNSYDWNNHRIWQRNSWHNGGWNNYRSPNTWRAQNRTIPSWYSRRNGTGSALAGRHSNRIAPLTSNTNSSTRIRPIRPSPTTGTKTAGPVHPSPTTGVKSTTPVRPSPTTPRPTTSRPRLTPEGQGSTSRGHQTRIESQRGSASRQSTNRSAVQHTPTVRTTPSRPVQRSAPSRPTIRQETQHYSDRSTTQRQSNRGASSRSSSGSAGSHSPTPKKR